MSILLNKDFTFIVQGITGREAVNLTRECLDYGSKIVGGVTPGRKGRDVPIWESVREDWEFVFNINVTGLVLCCKAVLPGMIERKYGRIVNIASIAQ